MNRYSVPYPLRQAHVFSSEWILNHKLAFASSKHWVLLLRIQNVTSLFPAKTDALTQFNVHSADAKKKYNYIFL